MRVISPHGEVVIDLPALTESTNAVSLPEALSQLEFLDEIIKRAVRIRGFLEFAAMQDMEKQGITEYRAGDFLYQLKSDLGWKITDPAQMESELVQMMNGGKITKEEFDRALKIQVPPVTKTFHHGELNKLVRRNPKIDTLRVRIDRGKKVERKTNS